MTRRRQRVFRPLVERNGPPISAGCRSEPESTQPVRARAPPAESGGTGPTRDAADRDARETVRAQTVCE